MIAITIDGTKYYPDEAQKLLIHIQDEERTEYKQMRQKVEDMFNQFI